MLPPQQLVLLRQLRRRFLDLALELRRSLFQAFEETRLVEGFGEVVQDRHHPDELALLRENGARQGLDRKRLSRRGVGQVNFTAVALLTASA